MGKGVKNKQNVITVLLGKKHFSAGDVVRGIVNVEANTVRAAIPIQQCG